MANERVNIIFTSRGTRRVRRNVTDIGDSARTSATAVGFLGRALGTLGIGLSLTEFVRFSDTATRLGNQLRTVTTDVGNLNRVTDELFQTARRSRSGIEPTVELYSRLQRSTSELGLSQREILDITEGVTKAFKIFGNTADEAEAAMVQFSQGLASGSIKGDELRSVLEQAPRLAKAIADGFNEIGEVDLAKSFGQGFKLDDGTFDYDIVIGSLRDLGQEGELTAERVVQALQTQLGALDAEFQQTLPTIEDAFVQLRNKVIQFFTGPGTQDLAVNITKGLLAIVDNFDLIVQGATVASAAILTIFVGQALKAAIAGIKALTLAIAANPIGFLVVALTTATTAAIVFGEKIAGASDTIGSTLKDEAIAGVKTLVDVFVVAFDAINVVITSFFNFFKKSSDDSEAGWRENLKSMLNISLTIVGAIFGVFSGLFVGVKQIFTNWGSIVSDVSIQIQNTFIILGNKIENIWITISNAMERTVFGAAIAIENFFRGVIDSILEDFNAFASAIERLTGKDFSIELLGDAELDETRLNIRELIDELDGTKINPDAGAFKDIGVKAGEAMAEGFSFFTEGVPKMFSINLQKELGKVDAPVVTSDLTTFGDQRTKSGKIGDGANSGKDEKLTSVEKLTVSYAAALEKVNRELDGELQLLGQLGPAREVQEQFNRIETGLLEKKIKLKIAEAEAANGTAKLTTQEIENIRQKVQLLPEETEAIRTKLELLQAEKGIQQELQAIYEQTVGVQENLAERYIALQRAQEEGLLTNEQYKQSLIDMRVEASNLQIQMGEGDWVDSAISIMGRLQEGYTNILSSLTDNFGQFFQSLTDGFANSVGQSIVYSKNLGAALKDVAKSALAELIAGLVKMGIQFVINAALGKAASASMTAASVAEAGIVAAAWSPAAAAVSLASFGANAAPATAGIVGTHAISKLLSSVSAVGFADGGFVQGPGTGRSDSIPAMLSNGEFVINAMSTSQYLPLLKAINAGRVPSMFGFADGGQVGAVPVGVPIAQAANMNITAANAAPIKVELNITVEGGGSEKEDRETGRRIAEEIRPVILDVIRDEKRDGGELQAIA